MAGSFTYAVSEHREAFFRSSSADKKWESGRKAYPAVLPALSPSRLNFCNQYELTTKMKSEGG